MDIATRRACNLSIRPASHFEQWVIFIVELLISVLFLLKSFANESEADEFFFSCFFSHGTLILHFCSSPSKITVPPAPAPRFLQKFSGILYQLQIVSTQPTCLYVVPLPQHTPAPHSLNLAPPPPPHLRCRVMFDMGTCNTYCFFKGFFLQEISVKIQIYANTATQT